MADPGEHRGPYAQRHGQLLRVRYSDRPAQRRHRGRAAMGRDDSPRPLVSAETPNATRDQAGAGHREIFGQPRGLATLFLTEMWERFTYYGMRSILILFAVAAVRVGGLGIDDRTASSIYGLFVAGSYLFLLLCRWVARRPSGGGGS